MQSTTAFLLVLAAVPCFSQRPSYAGLRPIGYPDAPVTVDITNRFGGNLPPQLNGDAAYADRLGKLPESQQPIWFLNQQQYIDELKNPQTYPQRPSIFNENKV